MNPGSLRRAGAVCYGGMSGGNFVSVSLKLLIVTNWGSGRGGEGDGEGDGERDGEGDGEGDGDGDGEGDGEGEGEGRCFERKRDYVVYDTNVKSKPCTFCH